MPVDSAISPPIIMAIRMPLPASAVAAPSDVNSPVPTIIAAVSSVAGIFPQKTGADLSPWDAPKAKRRARAALEKAQEIWRARIENIRLRIAGRARPLRTVSVAVNADPRCRRGCHVDPGQ